MGNRQSGVSPTIVVRPRRGFFQKLFAKTRLDPTALAQTCPPPVSANMPFVPHLFSSFFSLRCVFLHSIFALFAYMKVVLFIRLDLEFSSFFSLLVIIDR
uniref:Uncharacterized protein n=1 Tax=Angiostrongylus cantonensis TaxID=6313 RepID=A0A0K0D9G6_ANGCA